MMNSVDILAALRSKASILGKDGLLSQAADLIERLEKLVYVPGLWRCPKCELQLLQSNLNTADGTVTARDTPGDKCPNCHGPLWRVTERDAGNKLIDDAERVMTESRALRNDVSDLIARCMQDVGETSDVTSDHLETIELLRECVKSIQALTTASPARSDH